MLAVIFLQLSKLGQVKTMASVVFSDGLFMDFSQITHLQLGWFEGFYC